MRRLIHFNRNDAGRLHCDNTQCNHVLDRGAVEWGVHLVGMPCPKCGESLLTFEDYIHTERLFQVIEWINAHFSWLPWARHRNDPELCTVSMRTHAGKLEIDSNPERTDR